ncbi:MAG: hypothetical protein M1819_004921 [Sarea resinae]|nr:MAG: hypothetical protein M1819_004921 [Sarea resinae]
MKRKAEEHQKAANGADLPKKRAAFSDEIAKTKFRPGLFDKEVLDQYIEQHSKSEPYLHCVISNLIEPTLLRNVRDEIRENISFTPKETDIYRIHQSGDLANLDGLEDSALRQLPSLLTLRNAIYSSAFRTYLSSITNSGPLSGTKTDMAINVYTPGCHLLCHDDVIGSRRISWILYLTDPDRPWKPQWGGALRLFPTKSYDVDGKETKVPEPDVSLIVPPAFNQLSFFVVQPGESFHDVEEVFARAEGEAEEDDGGRVRMAISGWFHIPQEGEEGFIKGMEESLAEKSSFIQLRTKADRFDFPKDKVELYEPVPADDNDEAKDASGKGKQNAASAEDEDEEEDALSEHDLDFLLKFLAPTYLTPDTLEELAELFADESSLRISKFLSPKFADKLRAHIEAAEKSGLPATANEIEKSTEWKVARPPHKQRYLYQQTSPPKNGSEDNDPVKALLNELLPSKPFRKWLTLATGLGLTSYNLLARRFRRGEDYTLASTFEEGKPRLEITLGVTPTGGWGDEDEDEEDEAMDAEGEEKKKKKKNENGGEKTAANGTGNGKSSAQDRPTASSSSASNAAAATAAIDTTAPPSSSTPTGGPGGYEVYMASDPDDNDDNGGKPNASGKDNTTNDPAVYRSANPDDEDDDDGVLFSMPPAWNTMSVVLRDAGVMKFVKYVGRAAQGDRWDLTGEFGVEEGEEDDEDEDDEDKMEE